ncbi:STAS domain-containing protein [Anaerotruncus colihominis]|nr:STAS domain-containing protein [Anaerotruncus colihominis]UOX64837.1 STAS domain-containing protein [Anaerotruncus colihominis]
MSVQIDLTDELVTAHIIGDIDHHNAREMRETIDDAVLKAQARALELDFRDVTFMDSSGIGLVMGRFKLMQEVGGSLRVVNIAGHLKKVMMLAGLDRLAVMDKPERRVTAGHIEKTGGDEDESM